MRSNVRESGFNFLEWAGTFLKTKKDGGAACWVFLEN